MRLKTAFNWILDFCTNVIYFRLLLARLLTLGEYSIWKVARSWFSFVALLDLPRRCANQSKKGQARFTRRAGMFKLIRGRLETTLSTRKGLWLRLGLNSGVSQGQLEGPQLG